LGTGSTFTLYLPLTYEGPSPAKGLPTSKAGLQAQPILQAARAVEQVEDDREIIQPGDPVLLIVEDDPHYARVLLESARARGFKGIVTMRGNEAIVLAQRHMPTAISLDIFLPDTLGWTVLSQLKQNPSTRHIPVQIVTVEEERQHGLERGAFAYLNKPLTSEDLDAAFDRIKAFATPRKRQLLVVEDDPAEQTSILALIGHDDVETTIVGTGAEALSALRGHPYDCVVLDLRLPDISGLELLDTLQADESMRDLPIVVFTGKEMSDEEETHLRKMAKSIVIKGAQSPERLLDETTLFMHRVVADLRPSQQRMLERLHQTDEVLAGKKVLVVDDDVRNIFALNSLLERHGMGVLTATNGQAAIDILASTPEVTIVLMDIMMPEMDGYETLRLIRNEAQWRMLPIIALTAKAMKGDREKCLEAGASDYIAKPVNTEQLLSLMRMWLHR
jgi:CheY-like chemotaxis protein